MEDAEIIQKIEQVQYSEGFLKHESMINSEKIKYDKKKQVSKIESIRKHSDSNRLEVAGAL